MKISRLLIGLTVLLLAFQTRCALATDLGSALNCGVLSTGGLVSFGTDSSLSRGDVRRHGSYFSKFGFYCRRRYHRAQRH